MRAPRRPAVAGWVVAGVVLLGACSTGGTDPDAAGAGPGPGSVAAPGASGQPIGPPGTVSAPATPAPDAETDTTAGRDPVPTSTGLQRHPAFAAVSTAMARRVAPIGGRGYLLVVRDGRVVHEEGFGGATRDTRMSVASTTKWMTAVLVMTLVDEGVLSLDDPLYEHLPAFGDGDERKITLRQMLSHTSGIRDQPCIWNTGTTMAACVDQISSSALEFTPGSAFSYGNAPYHVLGRVVEVVTGQDFQTAFAERVVGPLEMTGTAIAPGSRNPSPAAGASTTVHDVGNLLEMMQAEGSFRGRRILSPESVREIQRNQVAGYDTSRDYAVGITRIPTYGLGTWRDRVDAQDEIVVVSGNGARGFYPWIDHVNGAYGIVAVDDPRGAEVAVPASQAVVVEALSATATAG